jgi:hypothetical protein
MTNLESKKNGLNNGCTFLLIPFDPDNIQPNVMVHRQNSYINVPPSQSLQHLNQNIYPNLKC